MVVILKKAIFHNAWYFRGIVALGLVAVPLWQLTGIIVSVILAVLAGIVVGFIVSRLGRKQIPYDDKEEFDVPE